MLIELKSQKDSCNGIKITRVKNMLTSKALVCVLHICNCKSTTNFK